MRRVCWAIASLLVVGGLFIAWMNGRVESAPVAERAAALRTVGLVENVREEKGDPQSLERFSAWMRRQPGVNGAIAPAEDPGAQAGELRREGDAGTAPGAVGAGVLSIFDESAPAGRAAPRADLQTGIVLARQRRAMMKRLIVEDPQRALAEAIDPKARAVLPAEIEPFLEERIDGEGSIHVLGQIGDPSRAPIERRARVNGKTYHVPSDTGGIARTMRKARVRGIAVDGVAALHATRMTPMFVQGAATDGGEMWFTATGNKTLLIIRARFSDQSGEPATISECLTTMAEVNAFFIANSFGQTSIATTVTSQTVVLPHTEQWYKDNDPSGYGQAVLDDARAAAAGIGYVYGDYDLDAVRFNGGPGTFTGQANIGASGAWLKVTNAGVWAHELGHNYGAYHANAWQPIPADNPVGAGMNLEYGDVFDTMGNAAAGALHFNPHIKYTLGWLSGSGLQTVTASGVYRLWAHDLGTPGSIMALRITKDSQRQYWLDFRQHAAWSGQPWIWNGVGLRWAPWVQSNSGTQLIDVTPGSSFGWQDAPVTIGATFSDTAAGIHITPLYKNGTSPVESIDVRINLGQFQTNNAPTLQLATSATNVPVGAAVTLTATASDPDGDALAYSWDTGDRATAGNTSQIIKSWSTAGQYRVRCTVSDMKGKTVSRSVVITVGTASNYRVFGRVTDASGNPLADARVSNGLAVDHVNYRTALTDADGTYLMADVPAGSYTMAAVKAGYSLVPSGFINPLTLGPDAFGVDFVGAQLTYVIRGRASDPNTGQGVGGVIISDGVRSDVTGPTGNYSLYGVPNGTYTLAATKAGYSFLAVFANPVTVSGANLSSKNFLNYANTPYTVSGQVTGAADGTTVTIAAGPYTSFVVINNNPPVGQVPNAYYLNLPAGQWNIRATAPGMSFSPTTWSNPLTVTGNVSGKDFARDTTTRFAITGRVTDLGVPLSGVTVSAGAILSITDALGYYVLPGLASGSYTVTAAKAGFSFTPASHAVTIGSADVMGKNFATTRTNPPPTIAIAALANPNPVTGTTTALSVLGADDQGEEFLWYEWSIVGTPPASVTYSVNSAHLARNTTVTFTRAGNYTFRATVYDANGGTASSDVAVQVVQTVTSLPIAPSNPTILAGASQSFTASLKDQFGIDMPSQPTVLWSVDGGGSINSAGLFVSNGTLGAYTVTASGGGKTGTTAVKVAAPPGPGTGITREYFAGISGVAISDLTSNPAFPNQPTLVQTLGTLFEAPSDISDDYGQRIRGYFIAPGNGSYRFYIASDDRSELYLSSDESPANKIKIAEVPEFTASRQWDKYGSQQSASITLVGGRRYYIEALHKESNGGDHLEVGVDTPGGVQERPIPAHRLAPMTTVSIVATDAHAAEWANDTATFTVTRSGGTSGALVVNYSASGTASAGADYQSLLGNVTIADGAASATITITPMQDTIVEGDETVGIRLLNGLSYTISSTPSATATIHDDDLAVTLVASDPQATEPPMAGPLAAGIEPDSCDPPELVLAGGLHADLVGDKGTFTVTIAQAVGVDTVVGYSIGGTALNGVDYELLAGTVTIAAGQTAATIDVWPLADALAEVPETVVLTLSSGAGYAVGTPSSATVVIGDAAASTPALSVVAIDGRTIQLSWTDPFANETGYAIEEKIGSTWTAVANLGASATGHTISNLNPNTAHTYRVRATLVGEASGWSNESGASTWKSGDLTGDHRCDVTDLQILELNFGRSGANWRSGDLNNDTLVNFGDFILLFQSLGK